MLDKPTQSGVGIEPSQGRHGQNKTQDDQGLPAEAAQDLLLRIGPQSIQDQTNGEFQERPHCPE